VLRLTVTDATNSKQAAQTLNLRVQPAPPEEREVLERKPVIREEEPDLTLPAPRDPLQMQVRDAAGRSHSQGLGNPPAEPRVPKAQKPDELPEAESAGDKSPGASSSGEESSGQESPEPSSEESSEEPVEAEDADAEADETPPPLPPIE
jgi:hypothetical protein